MGRRENPMAVTQAKNNDDLGQSVSVLVAVSLMALLLIAGLVIDGGAHAAATRRAEMAASGAARAAVDAYLARARPELSRRGRATPRLFLGARGAPMSRRKRISTARWMVQASLYAVMRWPAYSSPLSM